MALPGRQLVREEPSAAVDAVIHFIDNMFFVHAGRAITLFLVVRVDVHFGLLLRSLPEAAAPRLVLILLRPRAGVERLLRSLRRHLLHPRRQCGRGDGLVVVVRAGGLRLGVGAAPLEREETSAG